MTTLRLIGKDWLISEIGGLTEQIVKVTPVSFNEQNRYIPEAVSRYPGFMRFDINPFMREIVECFDVDSPVREVNLMKGVQITYTTALESGLLYYIAEIGTVPMMYVTADKELASARIENNVLPMLHQSGFADQIQSSDTGNSRKTGKTKDHLQFKKGGYLVPNGANNANKMRSYSIRVMLKDEIDAWPDIVGKDGDPDKLTDDRCAAYWEVRKIFRGSTPLLKHNSKILRAYLRGDQRHYMVLCVRCNFPQSLRWSGKNEQTKKEYGFFWELDDGALILESVHYRCQNCGHAHYEHDKDRLFSEDYGAHWLPTARPAEPGIRSYKLPALYSPAGMQPWSKCVASYLAGFDPVERIVRDRGALQVFYNNILAEPFEVMGARVTFISVSSHRRTAYTFGQVPNEYAKKFAGSHILFLTCQVDVHDSNLAVAVFGHCKNGRIFVIDYWRFEGDTFNMQDVRTWGRLRTLLEETTYVADDGKTYSIILTLVDAGHNNEIVTAFCSEYQSAVYPILGRDRPSKAQKILEFAVFETQLKTRGFRITVDHYKDRYAPVLRRDWIEEMGEQPIHHFNAPVDMTDKQLKELTIETLRQKTDERGNTISYWHRPGNAPNELWDLLVYGGCAAEILAWIVCTQDFDQDTVDMLFFWDYCERDAPFYGRSGPN